MKKSILVGIAIALAAPAAMAQAVIQDWEAHWSKEKCYAVSFPLPSDEASERPGRAYVSVTHDRTEGIRDAISVVSGFPDMSDAKVTAVVRGPKVGERRYELLPFGGAAFIRSGDPEKEMILSMKGGTEMTVTWRLKDGSTFEDKYSLMGFIAARQEIGRRCPAG